ncbi:MAG: cysteine--tRNA ligase, partial [Acidimicrobiaceae bacterium]|nr:cysteine--tRNA ligase [Acidimicrobiaceae bacterium]
MLNIEGTKMSKSLGNYRTVVEMLDEHPDNGRAFRLLVLQTHYRKTMEVNADLMASARAACQRLDALARRAAVLDTLSESGSDGELDVSAVDAFRAAMDDDLGTPQAVAVIFDTLRRANTALDAGADDAGALAATVINLAGALGVAADAAGHGADAGEADDAIDDLVARRQAAREARDWATADALRDELSALGVVVEDTPAGPIWHRA